MLVLRWLDAGRRRMQGGSEPAAKSAHVRLRGTVERAETAVDVPHGSRRPRHLVDRTQVPTMHAPTTCTALLTMRRRLPGGQWIESKQVNNVYMNVSTADMQRLYSEFPFADQLSDLVKAPSTEQCIMAKKSDFKWYMHDCRDSTVGGK